LNKYFNKSDYLQCFTWNIDVSFNKTNL